MRKTPPIVSNSLRVLFVLLIATVSIANNNASSWVEDHDPYTISIKGFSAETNRITQDAIDRMEGRQLVPMRTRTQQAWYNIYTNHWGDPLRAFGRDVIETPVYQPRKDKIVYPFRTPEEAHFGRTNVSQD